MADLDDLLVRTSRTFAAAIPLLPEPLRAQVTVAYLLLRVADTFEDAERWPQSERSHALETFSRDLRTAGDGLAPDASLEARARGWRDARPCDNEHYLELLEATPAVLAALRGFEPAPRAAIAHHALRTAEGMRAVVQRGERDGSLRLATLEDLRSYCYLVAGIVGELLTDLFVIYQPALASQAPVLRAHAASFGEGLQLVNIVKDRGDDARDGRSYLPPGVDAEQVFALARADLACAATYVEALRAGGAPRGAVAFCAFPVLLARAALREVEGRGAGAKVGREEVYSLLAKLDRALDAGGPVLSAFAE